jgi:hypothetical protein
MDIRLRPRPEVHHERNAGLQEAGSAPHLSHRVRPVLSGDYRSFEHRSPAENSATSPGRIELHVGELALHGFDPVDPTQLGATVQQELSRLLTENGTPSALSQAGSMINLEGGTITIETGARANAIGVQIARAIFRGLER